MPRLFFMGRDVKGQQKASFSAVLSKAEQGDVQSLARVLSLIERDLKASLKDLLKLKPAKTALRVGITGPPGAGKSSLINLVIKDFRKNNQRVAVLAVDPSSPFSGGALLGDRVRMSEHAGDDGVFIRSIGSRGGLGGLSAATGVMARVMDLCGFDVIIVETVGVGQTELEIMNLADATCVVLVPESGDVVQTLKAGILEIADMFIVNKSDRSGAEALAQELKNLVEQEGREPRRIFLTSALKGEGVAPASQHLMELAEKFRGDKKRLERRHHGQLRSLVLAFVDQSLSQKISKLKISDPYLAFTKFKLPKI